jgi:hypothetical protein
MLQNKKRPIITFLKPEEQIHKTLMFKFSYTGTFFFGGGGGG